MKKSVSFYVLIALILLAVPFFQSCTRETQYHFLNDVGEIYSVEIVRVGDDRQTATPSTPELDIITSISNIDVFLQDFYDLDCRSRFGDPRSINTGDIAIKFQYKNGDYELIAWHGGQSEYIHSRQAYRYYCGCFSFDETQFESLLLKYVAQEELRNSQTTGRSSVG